jgi:DNA-binding transcriptional MerR regulator
MGLLIGEVARRCGLSASALRYYERAGLLSPPARISKRRVYESTVLGRIRIILLARDAGFSIKETKTFLSGYPASTAPAQRWRVLADQKLQELDAQMNRLTQMKSLLNDSFRCRCQSLQDCERGLTPTPKVSR